MIPKPDNNNKNNYNDDHNRQDAYKINAIHYF